MTEFFVLLYLADLSEMIRGFLFTLIFISGIPVVTGIVYRYIELKKSLSKSWWVLIISIYSVALLLIMLLPSKDLIQKYAYFRGADIVINETELGKESTALIKDALAKLRKELKIDKKD